MKLFGWIFLGICWVFVLAVMRDEVERYMRKRRYKGRTLPGMEEP